LHGVRPTVLALTLALEFSSLALMFACGTSSSNTKPDGGGGHDSAVAKDGGADVIIIDPKNGVSPGTTGYCSPGGGQCDMEGPGGMAEICTADLPGTPAHDWYCTSPCDEEASTCTGTTTCESTPSGSRCVPKSCDYLLPEGGPVDSGVDATKDVGVGEATTDAPGEAAHDATSG
jgi:hypothetical protein